MQIIIYLIYFSLMTTKLVCWDDIVLFLVFFYSLVPHRRVVVIVGNGRGLEKSSKPNYWGVTINRERGLKML